MDEPLNQPPVEAKPDPDVMLVGILDQMIGVLRHVVTMLPQLGGLAGTLMQIERQHANLRDIVMPPPPPPVEEPPPPSVVAEPVAEPAAPEPQPDHTEDAAAPAVEPIVEPDPAPEAVSEDGDPGLAPMPGGSIPQLGGEIPPADQTEAKTEDQHTDAPA